MHFKPSHLLLLLTFSLPALSCVDFWAAQDTTTGTMSLTLKDNGATKCSFDDRRVEPAFQVASPDCARDFSLTFQPDQNLVWYYPNNAQGKYFYTKYELVPSQNDGGDAYKVWTGGFC